MMELFYDESHFTNWVNMLGKRVSDKLSCVSLTRQDWDDLRQEVVLGALKGYAKRESVQGDIRGYVYKSAYHQGMKFILFRVYKVQDNERIVSNQFLSDMADEFLEIESEFKPAPDFVIGVSELTDFFLEIRKKRGERGLKAAERDARICWLLMRGYKQKEVAEKVNLPIHDVGHYRSEIAKRLKLVIENSGD